MIPINRFNFFFLCFLVTFSIVLAKRIVFPEDDEKEPNTSCKTASGDDGTCMSIRNCSTAIESAEKLKTCYFDKFEQFICCKNLKLPEFQVRKAVTECSRPHTVVNVIIHGFSTESFEFPYMMALGWRTFRENVYEFKCGGIMIENDFVLTAAHCVDGFAEEPVVILSGGRRLSAAQNESSFLNPITKIFVHPDYKPGWDYHDIAIIKVKNKMEHCLPACLWPRYDLPSNQGDMIALGYGNTDIAGLPSDSLLKAYLAMVPNKECKEYYKPNANIPEGLIDKQICAKDRESIRDTCQGDSGGPIILPSIELNDLSVNYVVGITSFGHGCALSAPGVYTRVSEYLDWIESIVWPD